MTGEAYKDKNSLFRILFQKVVNLKGHFYKFIELGLHENLDPILFKFKALNEPYKCLTIIIYGKEVTVHLFVILHGDLINLVELGDSAEDGLFQLRIYRVVLVRQLLRKGFDHL